MNLYVSVRKTPVRRYLLMFHIPQESDRNLILKKILPLTWLGAQSEADALVIGSRMLPLIRITADGTDKEEFLPKDLGWHAIKQRNER